MADFFSILAHKAKEKKWFVHASQKMSIFFVQGIIFFFTANNFFLNFLFVIKNSILVSSRIVDQFFFLSNIFSSKK